MADGRLQMIRREQFFLLRALNCQVSTAPAGRYRIRPAPFVAERVWVVMSLKRSRQHARQPDSADYLILGGG